MAAPVAVLFISFGFRDAKGQTATLKVAIGDATNTAVLADATTLRGHLAAISNASVRQIQQQGPVVTYGTAADYQDIEDKLVLSFGDPAGKIHRFRVPAPIKAIFLADQETPDVANGALGNVLTDFATFCYGRGSDTAPLGPFLGGLRARSRFQRRFNLLTKSPTLAGPGE